MSNEYIAGSKKGAGSSHTPVEDPDSLRSTAYAQVLHLISEGEIEGLVHGDRSIFFDDTPLQNPDGTYNFSGFKVDFRNGTAGQTPIPLINGVEAENTVGIEVKQAIPIERTITDSNVDWVRVTMGFPALTSQNTSNGDLHGTSVSYKIEVSANGGAFTPAMLSVVSDSFGWDWLMGATSDNTPAACTGFTAAVRWTPNYLTASGRKKPVTATFRFQYRQQGTTPWITAGEQTYTADIQTVQTWVVPDGFGTGVPHYVSSQEWPTEITVGSFSVSGLTPAVYETRVVCVTTTEPSHGGSQVAAATAFMQSAPAVISGKCTSRYQRAHTLKLSQFGAAPWVIRVTRITPDSASSAVQNKTYWDSYATVIDEKLSYPLSALAAIRVDAAQFQSIPSCGFDIKGLKIKVPTNYDPITRVYTGSWDGTFKVAWTDNPAWIFYDLATNARYGCGDFVPAGLLDKWSLYSIAQYCDELVPDGLGGWEPRYTCNLYLQTREDAFKVLRDIASVFRGMTYWAAGGIMAVCDRPSNPVYQFTAANVIDGVFTYAGGSQKARHNVCYVTWNDPKDMYRQKVEYVSDESLIASWGYVADTSVVAVGCTSKGQARRVGEWLIYTERFENETVAFVTGLEGNIPRPGDVVTISDPTRAGERRGGRLTGATASTVELDAPVTLAAGDTYTITIIKADGVPETKTVTTGAGTTSSLTISGTFTSTPATGTIWILSSTNVQPQQYRVLDVKEQEGGTQYAITALKNYPSKFSYIEHSRDFVIPSTSSTANLMQAPADVQGVDIKESLYYVGQSIQVRLLLSWNALPSGCQINGYRVEYRPENGNWEALPPVTGSTAEIPGLQEGVTYSVRIIAINSIGIETRGATIYTHLVLGKTAPPADVTGFVVARQNDVLTFRWDAVNELDVIGYEIRTGPFWEGAAAVGFSAATSFTFTSPRGGTFLVKAQDSSGNYSQNATVVSVADVSGLNVTLEYYEETGGWNGTKTNLEDVPGAGLIPANTAANWSGLTGTWEAYNYPWPFLVQATAPGQYVSEVVDITYIAQCGVHVYPTVSVVENETATPWYQLTGTWSSYTTPWVPAGSVNQPQINLSYEIRTSSDNVTWSAWKNYTPGIYEFRYLQFRITISSENPAAYVPVLTGFRVSVDVPDRVIHFEDQAITAAGRTFTFTPAFVDISTVQVTLQNGAVGDRYTVSGKTNSQVTINVYDSSGTAKAGLVDIDVYGYGNRL